MNVVKNYENACYEVAKAFWEKMFKDEDDLSFEDELKRGWSIHYIGNQYQGIWEMNDMFMSVNDMATALKYNATFDQFHEWYYETLYEKRKQNLENFLIYGWLEN